ncbi:MAG: adenylyl-sulfate kinase [Pirellulales bacterium]
MNRATVVLDGEQLRRGGNRDLGYSVADRSENLRRCAHVAHTLNNHGLISIISMVAPNQAVRDKAGEIIGSDRFLVIHCDAPWTSVLNTATHAGNSQPMRYSGLPQHRPHVRSAGHSAPKARHEHQIDRRVCRQHHSIAARQKDHPLIPTQSKRNGARRPVLQDRSRFTGRLAACRFKRNPTRMSRSCDFREMLIEALHLLKIRTRAQAQAVLVIVLDHDASGTSTDTISLSTVR